MINKFSQSLDLLSQYQDKCIQASMDSINECLPWESIPSNLEQQEPIIQEITEKAAAIFRQKMEHVSKPCFDKSMDLSKEVDIIFNASLPSYQFVLARLLKLDLVEL